MKKWIVFGAGAFGREIYYYYGKDNIAFFVDNNQDRVGDLFFGKEIISFKQYCKVYSQYHTVIAVRQYQSIERQLLEKGITEYTIYLKQREKNLPADKEDDYRKYLYTPTYITKIDGLYFIVDCWHHRIIYSHDLKQSIPDWKVLDDTLAGPHSIASDGEIYVADDTDHGEICIYKKADGVFSKTQTIYGLGFRPHKCVYDQNKKWFYVLLSESCEIAILKNNHGRAEIEAILKAEIDTYYARSIQIIDGRLFIVCRTGYICQLEVDRCGVKILSQYKMPDKYAGMNDITKIGSAYYLSVYTDLEGENVSKIVRTNSLEDLEGLEDVTEKLEIKGVPYFFSTIDGRCCISEIDNYSGISSLLPDGEELSERKELFAFSQVRNCSLLRRFGTENPYDLSVITNTNVAIGLLKNISDRARKLPQSFITPMADFYMSQERENLISWYPFEGDAKVLEIVSECGSISNILCEKCGAVTSMVPHRRQAQMVYSLCQGYKNIEVCIGSIPEGKKFNYILAVNLNIEDLEELLDKSRSFLEKKGKLIVITNNRLSESYWDYYGWKMPFREEKVFKREIELSCRKWNKSASFYYPLPDWTQCEMVCSDFSSTLHAPDVLEHVFFSKPIYNTALRQMIENHAVCSLAKSFLVEISDMEQPEKTIAINISSTKRRKEYQLNTAISANGYVKKTPVYKEGLSHIRQIKKNETELESRGIPILKGKLQKESYVVRFLPVCTLDQYIYHLYKDGEKEEAFRLLNVLKQYIWHSSIHTIYEGKDVLKTGYLDMVCQNVFLEKGNFLFFDQEWTASYVEPEFILYRAVKLLYVNNRELENFFPMGKMLERLEIAKQSKEYERKDIMFRRAVNGGIVNACNNDRDW